MRIINILFGLFCALIIGLLCISFIYIEKAEHKSFYYLISQGNKNIGQEELDLYQTQESRIFRSRKELPFIPGSGTKDIRITIYRSGWSLKDMEAESSDGNSKKLYYLKNMPKGLTFISISLSKFLCLNNMMFNPHALPFNRYDIVTYYPFIELYNYTIGGAQSFKTLRYFDEQLPPYRGLITLTSIRDEYLDVGGAKVKSECLILKEKDCPMVTVWVRKTDKAVIKIEIADENIKMKLSPEKGRFVARDYRSPGKNILRRDFNLKLKEGNVRCLITRPHKNGIYPAVILLGGENYCSEYNGLFEDLGVYLAEKGFIAVTCKRTDWSGGNKFETVSIGDEYNALTAIVGFLKKYSSCLKTNIGVIGLGDANFILPGFIRANDSVNAIVMICPEKISPMKSLDTDAIKKQLKAISDLDSKYEKDLLNAYDKTMEICRASQDKKRILGRAVYLKRMKEISLLKPIEETGALTVPILIVQGSSDRSSEQAFTHELENVVRAKGHISDEIIYFRSLDTMAKGNMISEEIVKNHVRTPKEVFQSICDWLKKINSQN